MTNLLNIYDLLAGNTKAPTFTIPPKESDPHSERFSSSQLYLPLGIAPLGAKTFQQQREDIPFSRNTILPTPQPRSPRSLGSSLSGSELQHHTVSIDLYSLSRDANKFDRPITLSEFSV